MSGDDFHIDEAREAFRTRERFGIRLEIVPQGVVFAYSGDVLLWQSVAVDEGDADQMIRAMVYAITNAAAELTIMRARDGASAMKHPAEGGE